MFNETLEKSFSCAKFMQNFTVARGFSASSPRTNGKISEICALLARSCVYAIFAHKIIFRKWLISSGFEGERTHKKGKRL